MENHGKAHISFIYFDGDFLVNQGASTWMRKVENIWKCIRFQIAKTFTQNTNVTTTRCDVSKFYALFTYINWIAESCVQPTACNEVIHTSHSLRFQKFYFSFSALLLLIFFAGSFLHSSCLLPTYILCNLWIEMHTKYTIPFKCGHLNC